MTASTTGAWACSSFPKQKVVFGPRQIVARINQDQAIAPQITLWNQQGSEVLQGTLLVIPIEESLLYIRPLYLRSAGGRIPELKRVIVAHQNQIVMEETLDEALDRLFPRDGRTGSPPAAAPASRTPERLPTVKTPRARRARRSLAMRAREHYQRAIQAQRDGNWALYGEEIRRLGNVLEQSAGSSRPRAWTRSRYEREVVSDLDDKTEDRARASRRWPLHIRILAGLLMGAALGGISRALLGPEAPVLVWIVNQIVDPLGQLFLRLLLMTIVPLVFSSLVVGTAGIGNLRRLGRVGAKTLAYTVVLSLISVFIGLTLANVVRPGTRLDVATRDQLLERFGAAATEQVQAQAPSTEAAPLLTVVRTLVPSNPIESIARATPDIIGLMFFALLFGAALTLLDREASTPVLQFLTGVFEVVAKIIDLVMKLAPIGVACLLFTMTARFGFGFLASLGWFVATVLTGLALQMFVVYSAALTFLARVSPREFFSRIRTVALTAFSTSSSNATLPTALRVSEANLGVPREIGSFVLTVGATANQNGTALYEGVTVLFLAQLAGIDLSIGQQLMVVYLAILGGIGTAGIPSGSIPFIVAILATLGINPALIAVILGVDRLLDMCRTTLNVVGDLIAAAVIARSEGVRLFGR